MVSLKKSTPITFQVYPITPKNIQSTPNHFPSLSNYSPKTSNPPQKNAPNSLEKNTHGKDKNFYPYLHHGSYYILLKSL